MPWKPSLPCRKLRLRAATILPRKTREGVAIEVGQSLKGDDVVRTLNRSESKRGVPKLLFCDNGSEFSSHAMDLWAYQNGVKIDFSRPGKPTDKAFVESFNGIFRAECWTPTGSMISMKQRGSSKTGGGNTMRVVLTDLSEKGHQASFPVKSRLAAI